MALILDGNGLIQGLDAGGLPSGSVNADTLASTLDLSSKTMTFGNVSASGITFPASISASSNPNTLDDYEEGTFTPTVIAGFTTPTYGDQLGVYTKIGRIAYFRFRLKITGGTRNASGFQISLPFTSATNAGAFSGGAWWAYVSSEIINSTSTNVPTLYIPSNTVRLDFYLSDGNTMAGNYLNAATPDFYIVGWMECA